MALQGWSAVGWPEPGGAVGVVTDGHVPAAFMHFVVVVKAEEEIEILRLGFALIVEPFLTVMSFGPGGRPVAAGPGASAVSGDEELA